MVVAVAVFASSRRAGDHLQHPSTTIDTTVSNSLPYPTLSAPKSQRQPLLLYKLSRASSSPHFDLPKSTLLTYILPASYSASQFNRGASFCALKLLRTIQSLVGYILPSHQFLHSIPSCFLIPTYWLSLLLHLNTSHAHTSAAFNHRH